MLLFLGAAVLAAWDGVRNGVTFGAFFTRYLVILYVMEAYDILFFFRLGAAVPFELLFLIFTPEVKGIAAPQLFGYNKKRILRTFCSTSPFRCPRMGVYAF